MAKKTNKILEDPGWNVLETIFDLKKADFPKHLLVRIYEIQKLYQYEDNSDQRVAQIRQIINEYIQSELSS